MPCKGNVSCDLCCRERMCILFVKQVLPIEQTYNEHVSVVQTQKGAVVQCTVGSKPTINGDVL